MRGWLAAAAGGVDMSLLEAMLRRTPLERMKLHAAALNTAQQLRKGMEARRG